jgi:hypothetical protein
VSKEAGECARTSRSIFLLACDGALAFSKSTLELNTAPEAAEQYRDFTRRRPNSTISSRNCGSLFPNSHIAAKKGRKIGAASRNQDPFTKAECIPLPLEGGDPSKLVVDLMLRILVRLHARNRYCSSVGMAKWCSDFAEKPEGSERVCEPTRLI